MDKKLVDKIVTAFFDFLSKNASKEVAKPVQPIIVVQNEQKLEIHPITKDDLLMGRDRQYASEYTNEISANLDKLLIVINKIQQAYGQKLKINSGWRPAAVNASIPGAAAKSKHMAGLAVDISDENGDIMRWTLNNLDLMKQLDVYMESWDWTPTWTHFQIGGPKSGNRIFIPSAAPALAPNRWSGKYLAKYN